MGWGQPCRCGGGGEMRAALQMWRRRGDGDGGSLADVEGAALQMWRRRGDGDGGSLADVEEEGRWGQPCRRGGLDVSCQLRGECIKHQSIRRNGRGQTMELLSHNLLLHGILP